MSDLLQQAVATHQSGNLDEAERLYTAVLQEQPEQPDALALFGVVCAARGQFDKAIDLIERAIAQDPKSALFRFHLGNTLMAARRLPDAAAAFREATFLHPTMAPAHYNYGNVLRASEDWKGAIRSYRTALQHQPNYPEAWNNLALALVHEKQYDEALEASKQSVAFAPDYGEGWLTLCNVAEQVKDYPLALEAGERNIRLLPNNHRAWFGYGVALNRLDRNEEAVKAYQYALELKPDRADIWDNLGQTYQSLNRLDDAEATFRKTVEVAGQAIADEDTRAVDETEYGNRHWHLALMELLRGKYKPGFARYRARFKDVGGLQRPKFSKPVWKGEDLTGKTILVCDEQGYGDTLMLARYLPLLKQRGARVKFSVHPVLQPLFQGWAGADDVIVHGTTVAGSDYDYYASVFDLPYVFGTTLETIPNQIPYLPVLEPDENTKLPPSPARAVPSHPLPPMGGEGRGPALASASGGKGEGGIKVGVVWGGSPLHSNDSRRSVPLKIFAKLFEDQNLQFFSFNRDKKDGDEALLPSLPLVDLVPKLKNFAEAAKLIGQMDLIITVDTATAHLAGGLGKKVWVLLPFAPDWRWLTGRDDSPWYPTARLFRQEKISDWDSVITRVETALAQFARS